MKRYLTEYPGEDGSRWDGPIILADSLEMARALAVCLLAPNGRLLSVAGELVATLPVELPETDFVGLRPN